MNSIVYQSSLVVIAISTMAPMIVAVSSMTAVIIPVTSAFVMVVPIPASPMNIPVSTMA